MMKKRRILAMFVALTAVAVFFTGCDWWDDDDDDDNSKTPSSESEDGKTYVLFKNDSSYAVDVYSDSGRNTKVAAVPAGGQPSLEWTPSPDGYTFYLSYQIPVGDDVVIPYNPPAASPIRIDQGKTTSVTIASPVSSSTLLTNRVYLLLLNESDSAAFRLEQQGGTIIRPEKIFSGSGSALDSASLVNPSERAWYIVNSGPTTTYYVSASGAQKPFPADDTGFQAGWFYTFHYTDSGLAFVSEHALNLEVLLNRRIVTFDAAGGSPATQTKPIGSGASLGSSNMPAEPTKSGYAFGGWYTAANGGGTQFTATTTVSGDITVYAKWVTQYTVTFDADGGSPATQTRAVVYSSASLSTITNITYNYVSGGTWTLQSDGRRKSPSISHSSVTKSRVSFTSTAANASISIQLSVSSESGYDFAFISTLDNSSATYTSGYYTGSRISGTQSVTVTIPVPTAGSHFIDIGYRKDSGYSSGSDCAWFKVTTSSSSAPVVVGAENMPSEPTKSGYSFDGWYTAKNGGGTPFTATTTVTGNITVYAKWLTHASVSGQISLQLTEDDPPLSNTTLFVNQSTQFSTDSGYSSYTWYWDGEAISDEISSVYTLAANSKTPGIYELSVFVNTSAGKMLSARCRVTIKAN
jgi:uncharacterized repeat protein (TIGR02543 family)